MDGFRLDAVKHIRFTFFTHWLETLREQSGRELWAVGEYWSPDLPDLTHYLDSCGRIMSLFDVPLHFNFARASESGGNFDMRRIFEGTLVDAAPRAPSPLSTTTTPSPARRCNPGCRGGSNRWPTP